jgi:hypothetical protein
MNALNSSNRMAAGAAALVIVSSVISLVWDWGALMIVSLLAGAGFLFVLFQPQVAPTMKLPMAKGVLLLGLGVIALGVYLLNAVNWFGWIVEHIASIDVLQYTIGTISSAVMAWAGWQAYQAEKSGAAAAGPPAAPPPAPPPAPEA